MKETAEYLMECRHFCEDDRLADPIDRSGNYWKGSSTKEGATVKAVAKRRNKAKIAKKQRKQNRR